jgi:hypothetical protein
MAGARWILWSEDIGQEVVDLSLSPTSSMGCGGSWYKEAWRCPPVDVQKRHLPSLLVVGLFLDSQTLTDDASFSLAIHACV